MAKLIEQQQELYDKCAEIEDAYENSEYANIKIEIDGAEDDESVTKYEYHEVVRPSNAKNDNSDIYLEEYLEDEVYTERSAWVTDPDHVKSEVPIVISSVTPKMPRQKFKDRNSYFHKAGFV